MAAPMNRGGYPYQFDKEIAKMVMDGYMDEPSQYDKIAKIENFPKGKTYTEAEISGLGQLRALGEGEAISFDAPAEGHKKSIQTVKFGLGFQVTDDMSEDELFGMSKKMAGSLSKSAAYCREQNFFNLFNNAFTTELCWDGNPIFYATHTTMKSGDTINNLGTADLSDTSLKAAFEYFDLLKDEAGLPVYATPNMLLIPNALRYIAHDLLKSTGRVWSNVDANGITNDTTHWAGVSNADKHFSNALNPDMNVVPKWDYMVSRYLTDDDAWFLLSDQHDFRFYWKKKPTVSSSDDFATDNKMFKLVTRFATACFDYKGAYGSPGA
jgi:phage major head subunit gpT-like protein